MAANGLTRWAIRISALGGALAVIVGLIASFDHRYEKAAVAGQFREEIRANIVEIRVSQLLIRRSLLNVELVDEQRRGGGRGVQRIVDELRDVERELTRLQGERPAR